MKTEVKMEALSETMLEGTIVQWLKKEGDTISRGQALLEVESDKASIEVDSPVSGIVTKILYAEGESVPVGGVMMIVESPEEESGKKETEVENKADTETAKIKAEIPKPGSVITDSNTSDRIPASPAAKRLAKEHGIKMENIKGIGSGGLITEADVRAYLDRTQDTQVSGDNEDTTTIQNEYGDEEHIPLVGIRRTIAERMSLSRHTAADVTTVLEVDMTDALDFKEQHGLSVTPMIVKATVEALKGFPIMNSSLIDGNIIIKKYININVAVGTEYGLVVPVIHSAERKTIEEIAQELKSLTVKARGRHLDSSDLSNGTFTITNSGIFGSYFSTPIISQPQSAILGIGAIHKAPAVVGESIEIRSLMYLSLSYDHRVIDGEPAVKFLSRIKKNLENINELV